MQRPRNANHKLAAKRARFEWLGDGLTILNCDINPAFHRIIKILENLLLRIAFSHATFEFHYSSNPRPVFVPNQFPGIGLREVFFYLVSLHGYGCHIILLQSGWPL